jgi:hypothetical protein
MKKLAIVCVLLTALTALGAGFYMSLDSSGNSVVYSDYFSGDGSLLTGLTATSMPEIALLTTTQAALTARATAAITTNTAQTTAIGNLSTTSGAHAASIAVLETGVVYLTTADYTDAVAKADTAVQPSDVPGAIVFGTPSVNETTGTVTFSVRDLTNGVYADHVLVRLWLAASPYDGTPTTNGVDLATISAGSAVETVTANGHWMALTHTGGAGQVTIVATAAAFTNYLVGVNPNGTMSFVEVGFE